jgi:hypothetical protein
LNGKRYIADPVETVITGDFSYIRIPFEKFKNENAWLKVLSPMVCMEKNYSSKTSLQTAIKNFIKVKGRTKGY